MLLDRLDATVSNPYGSPRSGFNVTFSDSSPNIATAPDIPSELLTGTWAPQEGSLSTFDGMNPNGAWTLFIADESPGGVGTLQNWGVELTSVPDNGTTMGMLVLGASPLALWSLHKRRLAASSGQNKEGFAHNLIRI